MDESAYYAAVECYLEGSLSEEQAEALLDAFAADRSVKARFVEDVRWAGMLHGVAALEQDAEGLVQGVLDSVAGGGEVPDMADTVIAQLRPNEFAGRSWHTLWLPVAAALVLFFGGVQFFGGAPSAELARVGLASGVTWKASKSFESGDGIGAELVALEAGLVRLDFPMGVRLTVEGPVVLEVISESEVRLQEGALTAHVPPEGIGFRVYTDQAEVIDLGTTFGVSISEEGETDVKVYEGEVELVTHHGPAGGQLLQQGQQGTVLSEKVPVVTEGFASEASSRRWEVLFGVYNMEGTIRFVNQEPIRDPSEIVDPEHIVVFPERIGTRLTGEVEVTLRKPGAYGHQRLMNQKRMLRGGGRQVDTYLIQCNASANPHERSMTRFEGAVTFERPILAVISSSAQLRATDLYLGKRRFTYPPDDVRGLEHGDSLILSEDRRTLHIEWETVHRFDQIRVLVDSDG